MLTREQLNEIKELQEVCENEGGFELKLNFEMLANRVENKTEDFFHYEDGQLVGFLGSYGFGNKVELCGMVHPEYRRRGIFSRLLEMGLEEAQNQNIETILLNAPTDSKTAKEFLNTIPCTFTVAEYQMKWQKTELTEDAAVTLRPSVSTDDREAEIQLEVSGFGFSEEEARMHHQTIRDNSGDQRLIIEANGKTAGKMRVSEKNGEAWIYGFAIFPELRGKGIGRKALTKVVINADQKGLPIFLEVEAKNAHALGLYESCGFRSYHSQDYYQYLK
ncbi:GNAT family N-acetyltransferase [Neobacillus vireti]|uniref:GNAT family acetyltransferase n=1 Tax=Neobacillus vireti LMG 21834 TaxID=1131730 RepID=A0AB94INX4_9BACI|nr:GNAT family N-acetyltransferase [Neobacillus vireti]ETI68729.1 GNAT family acetyltransferase [Neobacillus vireti LMG 21834]KLT18715.1 GNAT family acetyltransferase [Neobacillus vireti]